METRTTVSGTPVPAVFLSGASELVDMVHRLPVRAMVGLDSDGLPSAGRAVGRERGMHPTPSETINDVRRNQ